MQLAGAGADARPQLQAASMHCERRWPQSGHARVPATERASPCDPWHQQEEAERRGSDTG
jgi:hypothetical protein